eukprot:GHUV01036195.1.p2 GENE.GHUV01036195.1~~GHUV01036195.1.p2  ORF type:complete len:106 (-),score=9.20 GHUV01036195.1:400-717(-)
MCALGSSRVPWSQIYCVLCNGHSLQASCVVPFLQELKRQSWRYHKHHNAWFQRYAEPTVTSEEYEQGTYVYFDYNIMHDDLQTGWCYRRKENFTFRCEIAVSCGV